MIFNKHSALEGQHAFLSASKYHWINYDDEKLMRYFHTQMAARRGSELHALAHHLIRLGVKLRDRKTTLEMYVNDAIGYRMTPEQLLFYSENFFGTPDAISFSEKKSILRISDLKTGETPTKETQLEVYAALFCLEYGFKPFDIDIELRIYQNDEIRIHDAEPEKIANIMAKGIHFDNVIRDMREEMR